MIRHSHFLSEIWHQGADRKKTLARICHPPHQHADWMCCSYGNGVRVQFFCRHDFMRPLTRVKAPRLSPGAPRARKERVLSPAPSARSSTNSTQGSPAAAQEAAGQARPAADGGIARWTATDSCVHQRRAQAVTAVRLFRETGGASVRPRNR